MGLVNHPQSRVSWCLAIMSTLGVCVERPWAESINLADTSVIQGEVINSSDSTVTLKSPSLGEITLPTSALAVPAAKPQSPEPNPKPSGILSNRAPVSHLAEPSDQALFFLPTAFLPPARSFTFRDFELLFMTFGYSPVQSTALSVGFLFPISSEIQVLTAGIKHNFWRDGDKAAVSITGNVTRPLGDIGDDLKWIVNTNIVAGFRSPQGFGVHGGLGYLGNWKTVEEYDPATFSNPRREKWKGAFDFGMGFEARMTPHSKFLAEYISAAPFGSNDDIEGGFLTLGFRLHGDRLAADIAGVRPITGEEMGNLVFFPLLVVSYRI